MSLVVRIKQLKLKPNKQGKLLRVDFRRDAKIGSIFRVPDEIISINQTFEWKLKYPAQPGEVVTIELLSAKWASGFRTLGSYLLSMDTIIRDKNAKIVDALIDDDNRNASIYIDFHVAYRAPTMPLASIINEKKAIKNDIDQVSKSSQNSSDASAQISINIEDDDDDDDKLKDIEKSIANVERTMKEERARGESWTVDIEDDPGPSRRKKLPVKSFLRRTFSFGFAEKPLNSSIISRRAPFQGVKNLFQFGRNRKRSSYDEEDGILLEPLSSTSRGTEDDLEATSEEESETSFCSVDISPIAQKKRQTWPAPTHVAKVRDYQVCVSIIEARQLAGLNIDPIVAVIIGNDIKFSTVKYSTNCPYYNEYFVFDFNTTQTELLDKIIKISVLQNRNIFRGKKEVGTFQMDIGTVWNQPDRQFYHKWAILSDSSNLSSGPRGYLKCSISVIGKGDSIKTPSKREKDDEDIEANLLVPEGMSLERQRARFKINIYRAEGLPQMNSSVIANVKQSITGEVLDLVDPYVQVTYAGRSALTSVRKNCYQPEWNEQIIFTEMFPPLCHRIKIQLRDKNPMGQNKIIGTHFIDLKSISNDGEKGFLPTFGPAYVHLYGSTREFNLYDEYSKLNAGIGEGVAYRARILLEVSTELEDKIENFNTNVEVLPIIPVYQEILGKNQEYFLMATLFEANAMTTSLAGKNLHFELSIGNTGNELVTNKHRPHYGRRQLDMTNVDTGFWYSTTTVQKPQKTNDNQYCFMPYWETKQCLYIRPVWPDNRQRLYNSNAINKIIETYEYNLSKVQAALNLNLENGDAMELLQDALEKVSDDCTNYIIRRSTAAPLGNTKLDKDRMQMCIYEIGHIGALARNLKSLIVLKSIKEKLKTAYAYLNKLKFLCEDPQHSLPDVFLWLVSGTNRIAYLRLPARDILFSPNKLEQGKYCGTMQTFFLKWPGKKDLTEWAIPVKLSVIFWLGSINEKPNVINKYPKRSAKRDDLHLLADIHSSIPRELFFPITHTFQLRSYLYQARSLIGSDATGLSDPFARVVISDRSGITEILYETLNPTWDQTLVLNDITLSFEMDYIKKNPPTIVIEVFDRDKFGSDEFIGRTIARPNVKAFDEGYVAPRFPTKLSWYDIKRGDDQAGELLAAFELLEIPKTKNVSDLPPLPPTKYINEADPFEFNEKTILRIPNGIRPTLSKYRIEVLFWGLRDLKRVYLQSVEKPRVYIECAGQIISSTIIDNASVNPNFSNSVKFIDVELPDQDEYRPPLTIRVVDCRNFGREVLVGTHTINSINKYIYTPKTKADRQAEERQKDKLNLENIDLKSNRLIRSDSIIIDNEEESCPLLNSGNRSGFYRGASFLQKKLNVKCKRINIKGTFMDDETEKSKDWWTKYYASVEAMAKQEIEDDKENDEDTVQPVPSTSRYALRDDFDQIKLEREREKTIKKEQSTELKEQNKYVTAKIYPHELEAEKGYDGFKEWLQSFELYRGKKTSDEFEDDDRVVGVFKGAITVYKWPLPKELDDHTIMGFDPNNGFFQGIPNNDPKRVLVRVYIVKATGLHPMDLNGKADPYISLQLGSNTITDKDHYISKQLNPVFGKSFEFEAEFPRDSTLTVKVLDWDLVSTDDLIGETKIDLEDRFYSRHRATCGLPQKYEEKGYNCWRDSQKPTQILTNLCKGGKIAPPIYEKSRVRIGRTIFNMPMNNKDLFSDPKLFEEQMALQVLHRWQEVPKIGTKLVVEHVEQRSLYNSKQPGVEQGRIQMWIDIFPMDKRLPGPAINITPRKPNPYELRVIIWNTDDVVLEDDAFFTGEKMSDIYVKGWLTVKEEAQNTDVHYRSLTGEGNFNWRFIHQFDYLEAEERVVTVRKETVFSWDQTELKLPARYELQVWDADHFTKDDCLGAIVLDLNRFPRGAKTANLCTLNMLRTDGNVPLVNIFKQKRIKGWWPFYVKQNDDKLILTGKVEAEFHLLTKEEAERMPAGMGRSEPDALEKPRRPDESFFCIMNPLKSARYIIWRNYKWTIIKGGIAAGIIMLVVIFIYSIPGYSAKKMLGA